VTSALFPRNFRKTYPQAVRGEGCYIVTSDGRRILDAAGSAAVVSIGHGVTSVGRAMAEQSGQIAFAHTSQFQTGIAERLAARVLALAPPSFRNGGRVYFTSGGSEATETALKLARQYYVERGEPQRVRMVARWQSYHGSTLGAMAVSGNTRRREKFLPMLPDWGHIAPCYCYRCPLGLKYPECDVACADELEKFVAGVETNSVAAFLFEPVVGATLGAVPPPHSGPNAVGLPNYLQRLAEICRRHGILLIADEVMTGMGRTGVPFAVQHWDVSPDIILVGKGIASGYAPLGAVIVSPHVVETIAKGSGAFDHGFTYQMHPVVMAASHAVLDVLEEQHLFERVAPAGAALLAALAPLRTSPIVGDVRGTGLLLGVEFVRNAATREPFPPEANVAERIRLAALERDVAVYPTQGCVDGRAGDHILLAPPFILSEFEIREIAQALQYAVASVAAQ
jgi:adenosylmethionine-8-amino-7-oxononanoate aminotransferase